MTKSTFLGIASLISISGCMTTPTELTMRAPDIVLKSNLQSHILGKCIQAKWEDIRGTISSLRHIGNKTRVMAHIGSSQLAHMAEVERQEGQSVVNYYEGVLALGSNPWLDSLRSCL